MGPGQNNQSLGEYIDARVPWISGIAALLLLLAMTDAPYGYYDFLRLALPLCSVAMAWSMYRQERNFALLWCIAFALLFQPVWPLDMNRDDWYPLNRIGAIGFGALALRGRWRSIFEKVRTALGAFSKENPLPRSEGAGISQNEFKVMPGDEGDQVVQRKYNECFSQWRDFLLESLALEDRENMKEVVCTIASKLAYANYLMIISYRGPNALSSKDAKALLLCAGGKLIIHLQKAMNIVSETIGQTPVGRAEVARVAGKEVSEYSSIVLQCQQLFSEKSQFPLDPLYIAIGKEIQRNLKTPAERDSFFSQRFREESFRLAQQ